MLNFKKSIYEISKSITPEKMIEKRGEVTVSEIRTTQYFQRLEKESIEPFDNLNLYRG